MKLNKTTSKKKFVNMFKYLSFYDSFVKKLKSKKKNKTKKNKITFIKRISKIKKYKKLVEIINQYKIASKDFRDKKFKQKDSSLLLNKFKNSYKFGDKIDKYKNLTIQKKNLIINSFFKNFSFNLLRPLKAKFKSSNYLGKDLEFSVNKKNKKYDQKIGIILYADHNLIFLSLIIDLKNNIKILGVTEIPVPGSVIGDSLVEDTNELANILLDSINLLDLNNSPLLVILSSSFFNIHTFFASDLKQVSETDSKVQSKSPYLPGNTILDFLRMSDTKISNSLIRTVYSNKDFIEGWTNTLEIIDLPVIGLIPAAPHMFDCITSKYHENKTVLIDIESNLTTVLIGAKYAELNSHKLPFGSSLYSSLDDRESNVKSYFERVLNSVKIIMDETNEELPQYIFVMGLGLDKLVKQGIELPDSFKRISELKLSKYLYEPSKMEIHELISESIDSSIDSIASILSSCI